MRRLLPCLLVSAYLGALLPGDGLAWKTTGNRWQGTTISYYVADRSLAWPTEWASYVWSSSGANVRLVRVKAAAAAQVVVEPESTSTGSHEAGVATLTTYGHSIAHARVGLRRGLDPYQLALVATHEFGHVLGLNHEDRACSVMNSWILQDHPEKCAQPPAGSWWCRLLTPDDVKGAIVIYGGRLRTPKQPVYCPRR
jgi:hypothetical protein